MNSGGLVRSTVSGPLAPFEAEFRAELARVGYTPSSIRGAVGAMVRLSGWLEGRGLAPSGLTPHVVADVRIAQLGPVLRFLREIGEVPAAGSPVGATPVEVLLVEFRAWLAGERGLSAATVCCYGKQARTFLAQLPEPLDVALQRLDAGQVTSFMLAYCRDRNTESAKATVTAVRALLRFLHVAGHVPVSLAAAVPSVAGWRLASLPRGLDAAVVERLLGSCDRETIVGCRDYAILTVLARLAFLQHLETERANTVATRNARLAAIHSLFRYAALRAPDHAADISRVLAIPPKRCDRAIVCFLTAGEIDALLAAPDRATWLGRRDHALLLLACQTGLRVSELTGLIPGDVHLAAGAHVRCHGKGRKDRATPLTRQTVAVLRVWLAEHDGEPSNPLFPTRAGRPLSRDAVERLVAKHATTAATNCATIAAKNVTPHTLRHSAAMALLHAGVDTSVIALWMGHEDPGSTQAYLHADMTIKEQALARVHPRGTSPGRYQAPDTLLQFLDNL